MAYNVKNSKKFYDCFFPLQLFLKLIGQMPYSHHVLIDGTIRFRFRYMSLQFLIYCIVVLLYLCVYLWLTVGLLSFMLGYYEGTATTRIMDPITKQLLTVSYERELIREQMVPIFVVWSWLTQTTMGAIYLLFHGRSHCHFMNHWSRVVCVLDTDCTKGVKRFLWISNVFFAIILCVIIGMFLIGTFFLPNMTGIMSTSDACATLLFRIFHIQIKGADGKGTELFQYRILGFVLICFAYTGSRAVIQQFVFFQKLLRNLAWNWDLRLINCLEACRRERKGDQTKRRIDFPRLLKDYLTMVQVFKFTNESFNYSITVYYIMTTVALILELYQLANIILLPLVEYTEVMFLPAFDGGMLGKELEDSDDIRQNENWVDNTNFHEFLLCLVFLVYQSMTCYLVVSATANAYEAAFAGYTILRRHGYMYCVHKVERNFMWNMVFNYSKSSPAMTSASGYFSLNRALFLIMANTIINYSVAMYQLKPEDWNEEDLVVPTSGDPRFVSNVKTFLRMNNDEGPPSLVSAEKLQML